MVWDTDANVVSVTIDPGWYADDGTGQVYYPDATSADAAAQEYVAGGEWGPLERTTWVRVRTWRAATGRADGETIHGRVYEDTQRVSVDPDVPKCTQDEHEWRSPHSVLGGLEENPGVQGHGGGVVITEVCRHCGVYRVRDTWAQDPETGEQGLDSVTYESADEQSLAYVEGYSE